MEKNIGRRPWGATFFFSLLRKFLKDFRKKFTLEKSRFLPNHVTYGGGGTIVIGGGPPGRLYRRFWAGKT